MVILLTSLLLSVLLIIIFSIKNGISPNFSSSRARRAMNSLIDKDGTVVDCGSGWGTLLFSTSKKYPEIKCIGIENSPIPLLISKFFSIFSKGDITFRWGNIYKNDYSDTSTILCYLYPAGMKRFSSRVVPSLKPGTTIISNYFALPDLDPEKTVQLNDLYKSKVYRYRIK